MSRPTTLNRGIVLAAFMGTSALVIAGCTPPMPPDVMAAVAESQITCQTGDVSVSVPQDLTGSMSSVGFALNGVCPEETVTEVGPLDPAPVKLVNGTPSADVQAAFKAESCSAGDVITIPAFTYPVTVAYNVPGLEGLYFTPEAVAGVLNGTVTSFEDPLIAGPNEGFDLTGLPPITLMAVAEPQGAVEAMTAWLTKEVPDVWTEGTVGTLSGAQTFESTQAMLDEMILADATFAVLPVYQAVSAGYAPGSLPTTPLAEDGAAQEPIFVSPDDTQLTKVGAGATTVTIDEATSTMIASPAVGGVPVPENFDLASSKIVLGEGVPLAGWPVMAYAHLLVCDAPNDPLPLSFAQYLVRLAGQGSLEAYGVTPLPEPLRIDTFPLLKITVDPNAVPSEVPAGEAPAEVPVEVPAAG